jgi:hypothetical protein
MKRSLIVLISCLMLFSCTKDSKSSCEENNTGNLKIVNNTSYTMDVYYYVDGGYYDPVSLSPGQYTTFNDVPAGEVEPYATGSFGDRWGTITIYQCQTSQYNWSFK